MHRTRNQNREPVCIGRRSIQKTLRSVKGKIPPRQYKELCDCVNQAESYSAKKHLIYASIQAKKKTDAV